VNSLPTSVYWGIDEIARCWVIMESAISLWNGRGYGRGDGNRLGRGGGHNWNRHGNRSGHRNRHGSGDGSAWLDTAKQALHPPNGLNVNGGVFWYFRLAVQEIVEVVPRKRAVQRRLQLFAGRNRLDQIRRQARSRLPDGPRSGTARRTGTDPSQGSWSWARAESSCSGPAMAKLWPPRNSTVVRARRVVRAGFVVPEIVTALARSPRARASG
jgi:hypothetical protein